jgi:hypothetical protein
VLTADSEENKALARCRAVDDGGKISAGCDTDALPRVNHCRRKLSIAAASSKLSRLEHCLNQFELGTLMDDLDKQNFRDLGHSVAWVVALTRRPTDGPLETRKEILKYLCDGSPKLRYLLQQTKDYVDNRKPGKPHKLMLADEIPVVAWFWELICRWLYLDARALHSDMTQSERDELVKRFQDPDDSLCIIIVMYFVSTIGLNLDRSCCFILIMTPGSSPADEIQAWGRALRVCFRVPTINSEADKF